jgi:hypothetical protein
LDGNSHPLAFSGAGRRRVPLRRGRRLEGITLAWNAAGIVVLAIAAYAVREGREIFLPGLLAPHDAAEAREEA